MGIVEVITVFAIVATNLGTVIALYIQQDKKMEDHRKETSDILRAIQAEMKDFHTKLALQDQEFKMRLCTIEERNRK